MDTSVIPQNVAMKFPRHLTLTLRHNEHKSNYQTVYGYLDHLGADADWVDQQQAVKAVETDEIWELQWYPDTPVGFCRKLAADLEVLLEWAERYAMDEAAGKIPS